MTEDIKVKSEQELKDSYVKTMSLYSFTLSRSNKCKDCSNERMIYIFKHNTLDHMIWFIPNQQDGMFFVFINNVNKVSTPIPGYENYMSANYESNGG